MQVKSPQHGLHSPSVTTLPYNPLSNILSFLDEVDGTCLLIANKTFTKRVLPLFELPQELVVLKRTDPARKDNGTKEGSVNDDGRERSKLQIQKRKHKFVVMPVQDPSVLLDRFNTRQLYQRNCVYAYHKNEGGAKRERRYRTGLTAAELAEYEHTLLGLMCRCQSRLAGIEINVDDYWRSILSSMPATFELRRFRINAKETLQHSQSSCSCACTNSQVTKGVEKPSDVNNDGGGVTLLTSYPRSGNSLLRSLLERITGVCTGTDTRPNRSLSKELALEHNMVGEGVTSPESVHVVKTHFPERRGWKVIRHPQRIVLLTRNPYDAIDSYFHMSLTNSHTQSLTDDVAYVQYRDFFEGLSISEMKTWNAFHKYWFETTRKAYVPMLVVRYEDLLLRPHESIARVVAFMLNKPLLTTHDRLPPFWRNRLFRVLGSPNKLTPSSVLGPNTQKEGQENDNMSDALVGNEHHLSTLGSYQPRVGGGIGKSIRKGRFSNDLLLLMHAGLVENGNSSPSILQMFQYDALVQDFPSSVVQVSDGTAISHVARIPNRDRVIFNYAEQRFGHQTEGFNVNIGNELRPDDSIYGRNIASWRKSQTENDAKPLPTALKE
jgi:hypothetical protein